MAFEWNLQDKSKVAYAQALAKAGDAEASLKVLQDLSAEMSDSLDVQLATAEVLSKSGHLDEAIKLLRVAFEAAPENSDVLNALARNLRDLAHKKGNDEQLLAESLRFYKNVAGLKPQSGIAHNNVGIVLNDLKKYAEAAIAFGIAAQHPSAAQGKASFSHAKALYQSGQLKPALKAWENVDKNYPNVVAVQFELGKTLAALNQPEASRMYYERCLDLIENSSDPEKHADLKKTIKAKLSSNIR